MKIKNIIGCVLVMLAVSTFSFEAVAQKKKELKADNEKLRVENSKLNQQTQALDSENKRLKSENTSIKSEMTTLRSKLSEAELQVEELKQAQLEREAVKAEKELQMSENGVTPIGESVKVDPNDTRKCAQYHSKLLVGKSYTLSLNPLNTHGWGVQIYSFGTLCKAYERAQEFSTYYKMYKTYIVVKNVNGRKVFSVVYGSLKDEAQARVYCNNFRKIAKDPEGQKAFLIQHNAQ